MALKFTPPMQLGRYALYVESEYGNHTFRLYTDLGSAKQSLAWHTSLHRSDENSTTRNNAKILEMVDGEWYTLHDVPKGTKSKDLPWVKRQYKSSRYYGFIRYYDEKPNYVDTVEVVRAVPMTKEEYAEWRIRVELERRGINV